MSTEQTVIPQSHAMTKTTIPREETSQHPAYPTERERLAALAKICEEARALEKIIKDAVKRNPNAFTVKV